MVIRIALGILAVVGITLSLRAAEALTLTSPDGRVAVRISDAGSGGKSDSDGFRVSFDGKPLVTGTLALAVQGADLLRDAVRRGSRNSMSDSSYVAPFNQSNPVRDHYRELAVDFQTSAGPVRKVTVVFRVYNDAVAYRYVIPKQGNAQSIEITDEPGTFQLAGDPGMWPLYLANYTTSHEGLYTNSPYSLLATNRLMDVPLLAEFEGGVSVAIAQASLRNYAGLYLSAEGQGAQRLLRGRLSPLPGQGEVKVRSALPLLSPWRVLLVGAAPGRLIESNTILNLNEPNAIGDTSWLKDGKATFYWWNGVQAPLDPTEAAEWEKRYIDFAAQSGFAFHAVIGTIHNNPWYHQTRAGYHPPGPDADPTRARDGFPMKEVVDYAHSKGIGVRLWVHWKPLHDRLEEAFTQYEKWGISGLMVDFLNRDDQEMVLFAEEVLKSAARHHLHIQFHGVWAPTGLNRTYPNLFNHEGVYNLEMLRGSDLCSPEHNLIVPFTRMLAGPMDYHLGGFRAVTRAAFNPNRVKTEVLGTRAHHLAMYVVYENPMPMAADFPSAYEGQPGFDFLKLVPTDWDETRVLSGRVGDYIVMARRKGADWYVGAMTDWTGRSLEVPLDFLSAGQYEVTAWSDTDNTEDPNQISLTKRTMDNKASLTLRLAGGGGQVAWIHSLRQPATLPAKETARRPGPQK